MLIGLVFPRRCAICGDIAIPKGHLVCRECRRKPVIVKEPRCKKCSKPISSGELEYCYDCSSKEFHYNRGISLWLYDQTMKQSMIRFKYKNCKEYADYYVNELVRHLGKEILAIGPDVLLPVPVHKSRKRQRGYNQAELLATLLGRQLQIEVRTDILIRTVKTKPQKELSNVERMKNLERAFAVSEKCANQLSKFHKLIIIDDIYTTGSTIEACTKVLKKAGAGEVYFITLCIGQGF